MFNLKLKTKIKENKYNLFVFMSMKKLFFYFLTSNIKNKMLSSLTKLNLKKNNVIQ